MSAKRAKTTKRTLTPLALLATLIDGTEMGDDLGALLRRADAELETIAASDNSIESEMRAATERMGAAVWGQSHQRDAEAVEAVATASVGQALTLDQIDAVGSVRDHDRMTAFALGLAAGGWRRVAAAAARVRVRKIYRRLQPSIPTPATPPARHSRAPRRPSSRPCPRRCAPRCSGCSGGWSPSRRVRTRR
jgi:hypothetical protein